MSDHSMGLKQQAVAGMLWIGGSRLVNRVADQVFTFFLVRLLAPQDFGLMAMATVVTTMFGIFAEMGLARAIVQRQDLDEDYLSTAFWVNVAAGLALGAVTLGIANLISVFYHQPLVKPVLGFLGLQFVLEGVSLTQHALLTREMKFAALTSRYVASVVVGGLAGVAFALAGAGVWSLVAQALTGSVARAILLWYATAWRPQARFSWSKFTDLWGFGSRVIGSRFFSFVIKQCDNVLIGRMMGPIALGYYAFAYGMFLAPLVDISIIVSRVTFSAFSRLQHSVPHLRAGFLMTTEYITFLSLPVLVGLFLVASDLVRVIFGSRWLPAVPALRVLLVAGMLQTQMALWGALLQAMGRVDWLLKWSIASACIYVPAFAIGLRWGIVGVAAGYTLSTLLLVPAQLLFVQRLLGIGFREYSKMLRPVTGASLVMGVCVFAMRWWLLEHGLPAPQRLAITVAFGCIVYMTAIFVMERALITRIVTMLQGFRRPAAVLAEEGA